MRVVYFLIKVPRYSYKLRAALGLLLKRSNGRLSHPIVSCKRRGTALQQRSRIGVKASRWQIKFSSPSRQLHPSSRPGQRRRLRRRRQRRRRCLFLRVVVSAGGYPFFKDPSSCVRRYSLGRAAGRGSKGTGRRGGGVNDPNLS